MPFGGIVRDEHVDVVGDGVAPGILAARVLERELFAAALGDLGGAVDDESAVANKREGDGFVLQVDDVAPVEGAVALGFVEVGAGARVEVRVVVAADDDDVAVAGTGAVPRFL